MADEQWTLITSDSDILNLGNPFYHTDLTRNGFYARLNNFSDVDKNGKNTRFSNRRDAEHHLLANGEYKIKKGPHSLFYTGAAYGFQIYKEVIAEMEGKTCPCCGKPLGNVPWNPTKCYCDSCNMRFHPSQKTPWSKYEEKRQRTVWWLDI